MLALEDGNKEKHMTLFAKQKSRRIMSVLALVIASFVFLMAQDSPSGLRIISSSTTTSLTQYGITWTFSDQVEYGQYVNGDYWVVGPVEVIGISPQTYRSGGVTRNGSMINPVPRTTPRQGYDSRQSQYGDSLNVAIGVSSSDPLTVQPNESLVSSISLDGSTKTVLRSAAVLTVVSETPPAGSFRPPYSGNEKPLYNESELRYDRLLNLPRPGSEPSLAEVAGYFERPWIDHVPYASGSQFHPSENMPWYGRDMSHQIGVASLMLHLNYSDQDKRDLLVNFVQLGIDLFFVADSSSLSPWSPDGGHASGRKWPIIFAGLMLDESRMQSIGPGDGTGSELFGEDAQTFYVEPEDIDYTQNNPSWDPDSRADTEQPYTSAHLRMPEWGIRHSTSPNLDNADWTATYRRCCTAYAWTGWIVAARLMNAVGIWNHDALFDYFDRYMYVAMNGSDPEGRPVNSLEAGWIASSGFALDMWESHNGSWTKYYE
jgi:hypothetical protein